MKKYIILFCLQLCSMMVYCQNQHYYTLAIKNHLLNSEPFKSLDCYSINYFAIMEELVPFDEMSFVFRDELDSVKGQLQEKGENHNNVKLCLGKKRGKLKFFFTEEKNGFFMIEVFCDSKKKEVSYESISSFGSSLMYLFQIKSDGVHLINSKKLLSN